jgi:CHAD domain-containing protein
MARSWDIVDLDPNENLKSSLHKIALTRFQETFSYENGTINGEDIEALHDMRVAARRLRAILRIFQDCFPKKKFKIQDEKLKRLIQSLGAVRERDVFMDILSKKRQAMNQHEGRIIDLLLARERNTRISLRKRLVSELRQLQRTQYPDSFRQFLREAL